MNSLKTYLQLPFLFILVVFLALPANSADNDQRLAIHSNEFGSALQFNTAKNYGLVTRNMPSLNIHGPVTVECWIYPNEEVEGWQFIVSQQSFDLFLAGNSPAARVYCENDNIFISISNRPVTLNEWHHLALTYDGVSSLRLYCDGELYGQRDDCTGRLMAEPYVLKLGVARNHMNFYAGKLDELRISDTVRNVADLWKRGHYFIPHQVDEHTIGLWHFDENTGDLFFDSSDNDISGQLIHNVPFVSGHLQLSSEYTIKPDVKVISLNDKGSSGWHISESPVRPAPDSPGWSDRRVMDYSLRKGDYGVKTLYCWIKDINGKVADDPITGKITYFKTKPD
jgi:Concanavalin A-like lectin/glucanases superfamily